MAVILRSTTSTSGDAAWIDAATAGLVTGGLCWDREVPVTGQGGITRTTDMRWPQNITITAIYLYAITAPTTAGTYLFSAAGAGQNLLEAANFAMTTLVNDTYTAMTLQTTDPTHLQVAANALIRFTFASNLGDLAGSGILLTVYFNLR